MSNEYTYDQFRIDSYPLLAEACQLLTQGVYLHGYNPAVGGPDFDKALKLMLQAGVPAPNGLQDRFGDPEYSGRDKWSDLPAAFDGPL